jgi:hypothetical protein
MPLSVFISHSVGTAEMPIVNQMSAEFTGAGVQPYIAHYHREFGNNLSTKVQTAISASNALVVLWTASGAQAAWVNQEVGFALGRGLPVYALVEKGVEVKGMLHDAEYLAFDPSDPSPVLGHMAQYLAYVQSQKELAETRAKLEDANQQAEQMEMLAGVVLLCLLVVIVILAARR